MFPTHGACLCLPPSLLLFPFFISFIRSPPPRIAQLHRLHRARFLRSSAFRG